MLIFPERIGNHNQGHFRQSPQIMDYIKGVSSGKKAKIILDGLVDMFYGLPQIM